MAEIYDAWHYKIGPGVEPDKADEVQGAKLLGEYSSRAKAEAAIERRRHEDGFRDWPSGFRIEIVPVDSGIATVPSAALMRLYSVWHFRIAGDEQAETDDPAQAPIDLGTFSSEQNANAAIERFKNDARFRDFPEGFRIFSAPPDIDHWDGGFISWDEA